MRDIIFIREENCVGCNKCIRYCKVFNANIAYVADSGNKVRIDPEKCICCGMCARRCPAGALAVDRKGGTWSIDPYACVVCGECIESCPKHCLTMDTARTLVAADKTPTVETKPE